jgi:hypothetical protein
MREYVLNINQALINGIRPEERFNRNQPFLEDAYNVRCAPTGLEAYEPITNPFSTDVLAGFPFPQLYVGESIVLLLGETFISRVIESSIWTHLPITLQASVSDEDNSVPAGDQWHIADLKTSWYLFNSECMIARINDMQTGITTIIEKSVFPNTGTHFRGRVVVGGLNPAKIWSRNFEDIMNVWKQVTPVISEFNPDDVSTNYVMWGSIGGGDFPLWLIRPEILQEGVSFSGNQKKDPLGFMDTFIVDRLRQGQFGFMPMPYTGIIHQIKELGNGVMVYGSQGVSYLPHIADLEPAPSFGFRNVLGVGIAGRGCVGGGKDQHLFIGADNALWSITSDLSLKRLGFRHLLEEMDIDKIVVSNNPERNDFYITDGETCLLFSSGMSKVHQFPTSLAHRYGTLLGLFTESANRHARVVSNTFDMRMRSIKTGTGYALSASSPHPVFVGTWFRYDEKSPYQRTHFVEANKEGNAALRVAGTDFRAEVFSPEYKDFALDSIKFKWQSSDRRELRGIQGSQGVLEQEEDMVL